MSEAEGKPEASEYENDDERIRGPLLPSDKSSNTEEPVYDRDPASVVEETPEATPKVTNLSRHKEEE